MVKFAEREAGVYRATFTKFDADYTITNRDTNTDQRMWRWVFQDKNDPTTVGEMDTITTPTFKQGSNALRFFQGMLGRPPTKQDDTDELLGQDFDVTWGPNRGGRLTIVGVTKPAADPTPQSSVTAPVVAGLPAVDQTPPGDLPF